MQEFGQSRLLGCYLVTSLPVQTVKKKKADEDKLSVSLEAGAQIYLTEFLEAHECSPPFDKK